MANSYEVLGVSENASAGQIKKAFRQLALQQHPDKGGNAQKFAQLKAAFEEAITHALTIAKKDQITTLPDKGTYDPFTDPLYNTYNFFEPETDTLAHFERHILAKGCPHCGGRGTISKLVYPEKGFLGREERFCQCQKVDRKL